MTVDPVNVAEAIARLTAWAFNTEQPDGAVIQHHGATVWADGELDGYVFTVSLAPFVQPLPDVGARPSPVLIVEVVEGPNGSKWRDHTAWWPLPDGLVSWIGEHLGDLAGDMWNGKPAHNTVSFRLTRQAHPSLAAAVRRYLAGCPEHESVFCGQDGCDWYRSGRALIIEP